MLRGSALLLAATLLADDKMLVVGGYDESIMPTAQAVLVRIPSARTR